MLPIEDMLPETQLTGLHGVESWRRLPLDAEPEHPPFPLFVLPDPESLKYTPDDIGYYLRGGDTEWCETIDKIRKHFRHRQREINEMLKNNLN